MNLENEKATENLILKVLRNQLKKFKEVDKSMYRISIDISENAVRFWVFPDTDSDKEAVSGRSLEELDKKFIEKYSTQEISLGAIPKDLKIKGTIDDLPY